MTLVPLISFDEEPLRGNGETGGTQRIARALDACGIDAPTTLYDEALALAREGRLAPSSERLRMLLCLDPSDAEAALLLGKVLAAREQWQEALSWLDTATANGAVLPPGLREMAEDGLRRQIQDAEEYRTRVAARERGEVRNLRNESKRLRSENAAMELEVADLQRRVRLWSGATAVVAGASSALLLAALLFGGEGGAAVAGATLAGAELPSLEPAAAATPEAAVPSPAITAEPGASTVSIPVVTSTPAVAAAAAAPEAPVPVPPTATTHTVQKGENLGAIARKYYGSSADWQRIQAANRDLLGKGVALQVGMKLKIPAKN